MEKTYKEKLWTFSSVQMQKAKDNADKSQRVLDGFIIKLSAGVFALSFTIINTFIPLKTALCKNLLLFSWISFSVCIFFELLSYVFSVCKHTKDSDYELERYEKLMKEDKEPEYKNVFLYFTQFANFASFLFLLSGMILLLCFIAKNF